ncbi:GNAT family N-acetyltransferase [Gloeobacter morelensis]|uniref:GNAT family N-acetyltransferase n=1 Tax=Gloeobacter morelensis MG652769 TaxID=2781736 RepID=A0ABY3PJR6_9CYAN|nr:GNAT family N-acetyltransferase [Gloeobacter morelensis]UFP93866.1 GNAT family N-acetyltransferase [Gloeobacter morelensis MG652769]
MLLGVTVRAACRADVALVFELICELAAYEKLSHAVTGSAEELAAHLFGEHPFARVAIAEVEAEAAGFALYFFNYSTFLTRPGVYLEDLYVRAPLRHRGIGRLLLRHVAREAVAAGCGRVEWSVLDWNAPAIAFYRKMGAVILDDWRQCRLSGEALVRLGAP